MSPVSLDLPSGLVVFRRLVLDYTGTLSLDGRLLHGVGPRLARLSKDLRIKILTADTFGTVYDELEGLPVEIQIIGDGREKAGIVASMDPAEVIAVGNGRNDVPMMGVAGLSIAIVGPEGAAAELLTAADVVVGDINAALDLILHPLRLRATLRD